MERRYLTEEDQTRTQESYQPRVPTLPHDRVHDTRDQTSQNRWQRPQPDVRYVVVYVRFPNVLKLEMSIVTYDPTGEREEKFREGRVNVKEEFAAEVITREFPKVYFVESGESPRVSRMRGRRRERESSHD